MPKNLLQHIFHVAHDLVIPETQHGISRSPQIGIAGIIVFLPLTMLPAIQFNDEIALRAEEISDVRPHRLLAAEFHT